MNSPKKGSKHPKEPTQNLQNLSTQQLKTLLTQLEEEHDHLEAKNEDLTIQISDLRNAVKCVEAQRSENATFEMQRKKELEDKIDSLQKGLGQATKNHLYEAMSAFKAMND